MNHKFLAAFMATSMFLCACGSSDDTTSADTEQEEVVVETDNGAESDDTTDTDTGTEEETVEETVEETLEIKDGAYDCTTFTIQVPDGWIIKEDYNEPDRVVLLKAESNNAYSSFSDPSLDISVTDYKYAIRDGSDTLEKIVESDKQFFVDKNPTIEEASIGIYEGSKLSGESFSHKGCQVIYLDLDSWKDGTDDRSRIKIRMNGYSEEDMNEMQGIVDSMVIKVTE